MKEPPIKAIAILLLQEGGICFAMKPDEMGMLYFWGLYVLEETLDFKA